MELLEITNKHVCQKAEAQLQDIKCKHPFVVVEGMDATGWYNEYCNLKETDTFAGKATVRHVVTFTFK